MAVVTVAFSDLDTWLQNQPANTADTPYELNITGLTAADIGGSSARLHHVLYSYKTTKFVDLSSTILPSDTTSMDHAFYQLTNLVEPPSIPEGVIYLMGAFEGTIIRTVPEIPNGVQYMDSAFRYCYNITQVPKIPNSVITMSNAFESCERLQEVPVLPDGITDMYCAFQYCSALRYKPIIPSTVTNSQYCYYQVSSPDWKGTRSQLESFNSTLLTQTQDGEIKVYNNDRETFEYTVYNININNLSNWLGSNPSNEISTAYKLLIRGLDTTNVSNIKTILNNNNGKYVDISYTTIPQGSGCNNLFFNCRTLVYGPVLPTDVTSLSETFSFCSSLQTSPVIPDTVTMMGCTFQGCTSLQAAPVIPSGVTNLFNAFTDCLTLTTPPAIPNGVTNLTGTFDGCSSLTSVPNIPSSVRDMPRAFKNCSSITSTPTLPMYTSNIAYAFENCTSLTVITNLPDSISSMEATFKGCTSLTEVPMFPSSIFIMTSCYEDCVSLIYKPVYPYSEYITDCYKNVPSIKWKGTTSLINGWEPLQTENYEILNIETNISYYGIFIDTLSSWLASMGNNNINSAYPIKIRDLTTTNAANIKTALQANSNKYVDLSYTTIPRNTNWNNLFYNCVSLVTSPSIRDGAGITSLDETFYNCSSLGQNNISSPPVVIPGTVTSMERTFMCDDNHRSSYGFTIPPTIPSSVTNMRETFRGTVITTAPTLPNGVTDLYRTFLWTEITNPPSIPSSVTTMVETFRGCRNLTTAPIIPEGVTDISGCFMADAIYSRRMQITEIRYIPSTITKAQNTFYDNTNLIKIDEFKIPLNTLKNNSNFSNMFENCTSLRSIGLNTTADDWHVFSLKVAGSNVTGKIYSRDKSSVSIPQTSITKSNIQMPVLTDELWFPDEETDAEIEDAIEDLIDTKYSWYEGEALDPSGDQFVMYAKDPSKFKSNIDFGGGNPVDVVESGNMNPVTSNAVANYTPPYAKNTSALDKAVDCDTAGATHAKTVTLEGFTLVKGARLIVNLKNANSGAGALTLNVNSTGAKTIRLNGTVASTSTTTYTMGAGNYNCYYDGTYWCMDNSYESYTSRLALRSYKTNATRTFTCSIGASTVAKTVSVEGYTLETRNEVLVYFSNTNTASNPTLNVNSTGAKPIKVFGTSPNSTNGLLKAGTYYCQYDGTNWNCYPYGVTNTVSADNMQSVTSNAVNDVTKKWTDISSQVTLTITQNNASISVYNKKVYMCGALLKFDILFNCNTSSLVEGQDLGQIKVTSSLFTLPYSLGRFYNPSYYGSGITTVGMNVYEGDNGIITIRLTKQASGGIYDFSFCATIPCQLS